SLAVTVRIVVHVSTLARHVPVSFWSNARSASERGLSRVPSSYSGLMDSTQHPDRTSDATRQSSTPVTRRQRTKPAKSIGPPLPAAQGCGNSPAQNDTPPVVYPHR